MTDLPVTYEDVEEAARRIESVVRRTPVMTCGTLNALSGNELFFKCELFQKTGAFKFRGASNAVMQLTEAQRDAGVVTHSSGNHAQALALAGKMAGVRVVVVMPENSPTIKVRAVKGYGAEIVFCGNDPQERERVADEQAKKLGACLIPSFNHPHIIAGQGTMALELHAQVENPLDFLIVPVGGGGMLSGCCLATKGVSPNTRVIAAEPKGADDAYRSFQAGNLILQTNPQTIADGLRTSLGPLTWAIIQAHVEKIITVDEDAIRNAMRLVWERMKLVIEPSAGVGVAVALSEEFRKMSHGKRVGVILCGGNIDLDKFEW
eukprot:CAMPEP_0119134628 /NCGR_PEP_ID=MMETSP1310-20130426/17403_1 /TAXON_ID=464262 /ORGANISM="Genus nov. species nov., Strain RCC2339" /LENGTH=319 /DNA_ID=CAMNT_0007125441 /DNA_START=24 /DNA_END=980 /DNA_ORIENTATION=+